MKNYKGIEFQVTQLEKGNYQIELQVKDGEEHHYEMIRTGFKSDQTTNLEEAIRLVIHLLTHGKKDH